jgi:predicted Zn-dependent peptidase
VAGNVKAEDVFAYAKKHFGGIKKQLPLNDKKQEPDLFTHTIAVEEMNIDFPVQIYSYMVPAPAFGHKDYYAFNLFSELVFENQNSIFNTSLVTLGNMAYQIGCNVEDSRLYNCYASYDVIMQAGIGNAKVKKVINKEINDIINEGFEQSLIDNYIKCLETEETFALYSNDEIAGRLGFSEYYYKDHSKHNAELEAYRKLKAEDLQRIAQTYFSPDKLKVINIKPSAE